MSKHLYVHVPFCSHICEFCDFFRVPYQKNLVQQYLEELAKELKFYANKGELEELETIYIGGGTPTALSYEELETLLGMFQPYLRSSIEFTIEANPENVTQECIAVLVKGGINRVSLGIQCLNDDLLASLNRKHTSKQALDVIEELSRAGISNISADLIYGLPNQTTQMFISDIERLSTTKLTHISIYSLTIEENSTFGRKHQELIDNELEGEMYERGKAMLEKHGFHQYEVANYARSMEMESRHNKGYWLFHDYVGIGMGAVGYLHGIRYENTKNFQTYLAGNYIDHQEEESVEEQQFLMIMLGLRLTKGICLSDFKNRFGKELEEVYGEPLRKHSDLGNLIVRDNYVYASPKGMELLHEILIDFME